MDLELELFVILTWHHYISLKKNFAKPPSECTWEETMLQIFSLLTAFLVQFSTLQSNSDYRYGCEIESRLIRFVCLYPENLFESSLTWTHPTISYITQMCCIQPGAHKSLTPPLNPTEPSGLPAASCNRQTPHPHPNHTQSLSK